MAKDGEPIILPIELDGVEGDVHKYINKLTLTHEAVKENACLVKHA